jgi:hypothetical protein
VQVNSTVPLRIKHDFSPDAIPTVFRCRKPGPRTGINGYRAFIKYPYFVVFLLPRNPLQLDFFLCCEILRSLILTGRAHSLPPGHLAEDKQKNRAQKMSN